VTSPGEPSSVRPVDYKGEPLDSERGPGLGCFRFQLVLLVGLVVLTPLTVAWNWPSAISVALLFLTLILLLFAGQTVIFLLRLVAADRREGVRHVPRAAGATPTVGQLEDAGVHVDSLGRPVPEESAAEPAAAEPAVGAPAVTDRPAEADASTGDQPADPGVRE
jgi:hypothetical protein